MTPRERDPIERIAYRPAEAAELLGIPRSEVYNLMASGHIPSSSVGRARLIGADVLRARVDGEEPSASREKPAAGIVDTTPESDADICTLLAMLEDLAGRQAREYGNRMTPAEAVAWNFEDEPEQIAVYTRLRELIP